VGSKETRYNEGVPIGGIKHAQFSRKGGLVDYDNVPELHDRHGESVKGGQKNNTG
jgi:hypothetical protein